MQTTITAAYSTEHEAHNRDYFAAESDNLITHKLFVDQRTEDVSLREYGA